MEIVRGPFFIVNENTGFVLDVSPDPRCHAKLIQWDFDGSPSQRFVLSPDDTIHPENFPHLVLDVEGGTQPGRKLILYPRHGGENQKFVASSDGRITNVPSGLVIGSREKSKARGAWMVVDSLTKGDETQSFTFKPAVKREILQKDIVPERPAIAQIFPKQGVEFFIFCVHSRLALGCKNGICEYGSTIVQNEFHGGPTQIFSISPNGQIIPSSNPSLSLQISSPSRCGSNIILTKYSDSHNRFEFQKDGFICAKSLCLDICAASMEKGAHVIAWEKHGGSNQKFMLVPVCEISSHQNLKQVLMKYDPESQTGIPSHFTLVDRVGKGCFADIFSAKSEKNGNLYALKRIRMDSHNKFYQYAFRREAEILSRLPPHPNLLRFYESSETDCHFCLVTELLTGIQFSKLACVPKILENDILQLSLQIFEGLASMHSASILHRDLHSGNILVCNCDKKIEDLHFCLHESSVKIIDFGLASCIPQSGPIFMSIEAGIFHYFSPERRKAQIFDEKDDVWAAACILAEVVTKKTWGERPGWTMADFSVTPLHPELVAVINEVTSISKKLGSVVAKIFTATDPRERPRAAEVSDFIQSML